MGVGGATWDETRPVCVQDSERLKHVLRRRKRCGVGKWPRDVHLLLRVREDILGRCLDLALAPTRA